MATKTFDRCEKALDILIPELELLVSSVIIPAEKELEERLKKYPAEANRGRGLEEIQVGIGAFLKGYHATIERLRDLRASIDLIKKYGAEVNALWPTRH